MWVSLWKQMFHLTRAAPSRGTNPTSTLQCPWGDPIRNQTPELCPHTLPCHTAFCSRPSMAMWWGCGRGCCWRCDCEALRWGCQHVLPCFGTGWNVHASWLLLLQHAPELILAWLPRKGITLAPLLWPRPAGLSVSKALPHRNAPSELTLVPTVSRATSCFQPWNHTNMYGPECSWIQCPMHVQLGEIYWVFKTLHKPFLTASTIQSICQAYCA